MTFTPVTTHQKTVSAKPAQNKPKKHKHHWWDTVEHAIGGAANEVFGSHGHGLGAIGGGVAATALFPLAPLAALGGTALGAFSGAENHSVAHHLRVLPNLGKDLAHNAPGMAVGLYNFASTLGGDLQNLEANPTAYIPGSPTRNTAQPLHSPSMAAASGKAMLHQWKYVYGPAAHGDFETTLNRIEDHPLGPVLDVLSVLSLGGGLAARGAKAAAVLGDGSRLGAVGRGIAGLEKIPIPEGQTAGTWRIHTTTGNSVRHGLMGAALKGNESEMLLPRERILRGAGGATAKLGHYSENPTTRMMEMASDAVSQAFPGFRGVGATGRVARLNAQQLGRTQKDAVYAADAGRGVRALHGGKFGWGGISKGSERRLAEVRVFNEAEGLNPLSEAARLDREAADLKNTGQVGPGALHSHRYSQHFKNSPFIKAARADLTKKANALVDSADPLIASRAAAALNKESLVRGGLAPRSREALLQRSAASELARLRQMRPGVTDPGRLTEITHRMNTLRKISGGGSHAIQRLENSAVAHSGEADQIAALSERAQARANIQRGAAWQEAQGLHSKAINTALDSFRQAYESTTKAYHEGGIKTGVPGELSSYVAGERGGDILGKKGRFVVPESSGMSKAAIRQELGNAGRIGKSIAKPKNAKHRTGFNLQYGVNGANAKMIPWVNQTAHRWLKSVNTWRSIMATAKTESELNGKTRGWHKIPDTQLEHFLETTRQALDEEFPIAFGDSPQLSQAQDVLKGLYAKKLQGGPVYVPTRYFDRLMGEITPAHPGKLLQGVQLVNNAWRVAVVSAIRPAFLTYNFIGQTLMLLLGSGVLRTMRTMIAAANPETRAAMLGAERAGAGSLRGTGVSTISSDIGRTFRNVGDDTAWQRFSNHTVGRAGSAIKYLSHISAAITDDPFRRMAFQNELAPFARKLLKERRKENPDYTIGDSYRELVGNKDLVDRVQRKVLDDLVDFDNLTPGEKVIVRQYINPFWGWVKGSSRMTALLVKRRPLLSAGLYHVGEQGRAANEKLFGGKVSDYYAGLVPIGGKNSHGAMRVLSPYSISPFQTPADLLQQIQSPFTNSGAGADNIFSSITPAVKTLLAAQSGATDQFTGKPIPGETAADRMANAFFGQFPQVQAFKNANKADASYNADSVMPKSARDELYKYFGVPIRSFNPAKAVEQLKHPQKNMLMQLWTSPDGMKLAFDENNKAYMQLGVKSKRRRKRRKKKVVSE